MTGNGPELPSASIVDVLRCRAAAVPQGMAFTFLDVERGDEASLTYAQLDARAAAVAGELEKLAPAGARALLVMPPGLELVAALFGAMYAGLVVVVSHPPHRGGRHAAAARLAAIATDSAPRVVVTLDSLRSHPAVAALAANGGLKIVAADAVDRPAGAAWQPPAWDGGRLALLQYTSGSTSAPKGVMVTHGNLMHNVSILAAKWGNTQSSRSVSWLPPCHDMGLIGGVLLPVYCGFPAVLMSPASFMLRPALWLEVISRTRATYSGGPNFAYEHCVKKVGAAQRVGLDLSTWTTAFVGAEPVRSTTLERFVQAFGPCGFRAEGLLPSYGLAEATLAATTASMTTGPVVRPHRSETGTQMLVGCGQCPSQQSLAIVDADTRRPCDPGQVGEIWLRGESIAAGYWRRPAETELTFRARLAGGSGENWLRTGDLGFVEAGELFVTGRLKDLVIVAGRNHCSEHIEQTVQASLAGLSAGGCAAFSVDLGGEERLIVAAEVERSCLRNLLPPSAGEPPAAPAADAAKRIPPALLEQSIRQAVAETHELRIHDVLLVGPSSLPRTTSGKIQRHECRRGYLSGTLNRNRT